MTVHECSVRSCGFWSVPRFVPTSSRRSFHSMHAAWQALQPMHFETSMSFATSGIASERTLGAAEVEAERRVTSSDMSAMVRLLSGHALRSLLDVHQERLELRGLGVGVADERRQRVGEVARLREPGEAPVDRDADGV